MRKSATHHKQVPNFMKSKNLRKRIGFFDGINNRTGRIEKSANANPVNKIVGHDIPNHGQDDDRNPTHQQVNEGGKPAGCIQPEYFLQDST